MSKVSIVTLNYNGLSVLKPCVESVLTHCNNVDFDWIIRENGSKDGSLEYLMNIDTKKDLRIMDVENKGNFASMNNEACEYVESEYILFLNNDVVCSDDFISPMLETIQDTKVSTVGAVLRYPNGKVQHSGIVFDFNKMAHNLDAFYSNKVGININDVVSENRVYQAATAACLLVKKEDFDKVRGFNPEFNWCYDDVDLVLRLNSLNNGVSAVPKTVNLVHHESYSKARPDNVDAVRLLHKYHKHRVVTDFYKYSNKLYGRYT